MSIIVHIPAALREFAEGRGTVQLDLAEGTVSDALSALWRMYPGIRDRVVNEQDQVRQHINIFIGNENIRYTGGLSSRISDGTSISIVPAVSGGSGMDHEFNNSKTLASPVANSSLGAIRLSTRYPSCGKS